MRRAIAMVLGAGLVLVGCGGSGEGSPDTTEGAATTTAGSEGTAAARGSTTTLVDATTTSAAEEQDGDVDPLSVMSQECIDLFVEYAQALEPVIDGANPRFLTDGEMEALTAELDPIQEEYDAAVAESDCPNTDIRTDRDLLTVMLHLTRTEAPGALPMMEWVADLADYYDDLPDISTGDCDVDLAELQATVSSVESPHQLQMTDLIDMENLFASLRESCPDRVADYFQSPEYQEWAGVDGG
ncbi:MAG TPA: hypothetical protein VMS74_08605 [Acidimicrobiia bacterium]|nr:hypothetical protein [Acidimicrobiia bacterium]